MHIGTLRLIKTIYTITIYINIFHTLLNETITNTIRIIINHYRKNEILC